MSQPDQKQKPKRILSDRLILGLFLIGIPVVVGAVILFLSGDVGKGLWSTAIVAAAMLVLGILMFSAFACAVALNLFGQYMFGWISGRRLFELRTPGFRLRRDYSGKLVGVACPFRLDRGYCAMYTARGRPKLIQEQLFTLGGPVVLSVTAAACFLYARQFTPPKRASNLTNAILGGFDYWPTFLGVAALALLCLSLNDLFLLVRKSQSKDFETSMLLLEVATRWAMGHRARDWDKSSIEDACGHFKEGDQFAYAHYLKSLYLWDSGQHQQALVSMEIAWVNQVTLGEGVAIELIFQRASLAGDLDDAKTLFDRLVNKESPSALRAAAAVAILEGKNLEAIALCDKATGLIRESYKTIAPNVEAELEWMESVRNRATKLD